MIGLVGAVLIDTHAEWIAGDELQVEHVMPPKWRAHRPIADAAGWVILKDDEDPVWISRRDDRARAVDRFDNLTLVTGSFNRMSPTSGGR